MGELIQTFTFDRNTFRRKYSESADLVADHIEKVNQGIALDKTASNIIGALASYMGIFRKEHGNVFPTKLAAVYLKLFEKNKIDAWRWLVARSLWRFVVPNGTECKANNPAKTKKIQFAFFHSILKLLTHLSALSGEMRYLYFEEFCRLLEDDNNWKLSGDDLFALLMAARAKGGSGFGSERSFLEDLENSLTKKSTFDIPRDNFNGLFLKAFAQTGLFQFRDGKNEKAVAVALNPDLDAVLQRRLRFIIDHSPVWNGIDWSAYMEIQKEDLPQEVTMGNDADDLAMEVESKPTPPKYQFKNEQKDNFKRYFAEVCAFCENYETRNGSISRGSPEATAVVASLTHIVDLIRPLVESFEADLVLDVAKGSGLYPRVPWIGILPQGQQVSNGIYVACCFGRDGTGAVLGCAQSASNEKGLPVVKRKPADIKVNVDGGGADTQYNNSFMNPLEFLRADIDPQAFIEHLHSSIVECLKFLNKATPLSADKLVSVFEKSVSPRLVFKKEMLKSFVASLATKPFVIVTGNSGTGKTKIAQAFIELLYGKDSKLHVLLPVGADWTDNRNIIGYFNPLSKNDKGEDGIFQSTPVLDLILAARADAQRPYFLVLDEMNLSHVERYFSDFLSGMESTEGFHLHSEKGEVKTSKGEKLDEKIKIPNNLFVVGTVNVDETTYMFSPKVLDRANVLEFSVPDLKEYFTLDAKAAGDIKPVSGYAESFLELSLCARGLADKAALTTPTELQKIKDCLGDLFAILQKNGLEFGYRTVNEVLRYAHVEYKLIEKSADWKWGACMDSQIIQKILPKLHGSRAKLYPVLVALIGYCESIDKAAAVKLLDDETAQEGFVPDPAKAKFINSHKKLCKMLKTLKRDQFVSFIQ